MTTTTNRVDARSIGNVVIMAILLVAGVMFAPKAWGWVSGLWHGEPLTFSTARKHQAADYSLKQVISVSHVRSGINVNFLITAISPTDATVETTDDDGKNLVYRCPLWALQTLEEMDQTCTDETGHLGQAKAKRNYVGTGNGSTAPAVEPLPASTEDAACVYASRFAGKQLDCAEVQAIGEGYFKLNHPEVLDK